jgi:hypothetical protein
MAHLHPSLEGSRIPASLRRSAPRAAIIGSAPAVPPSILSATDASLSGPVMHPPLRPAPPSSPSSPPRTAAQIPTPSRAGGRGDRLRWAESRWRAWRSAPAGRVALAGVEIGFRGLCEIDDADALQAKMEVMLLLPSCGSPSSPSSHTPPPPAVRHPLLPPRGGLDPRPYLLTLLLSAPRSAPSHPLPLNLFSYFKLVWSDLNCVSAQVSGGSASSWQDPPPERGCQARHRRRPFHHHGLHGMPLDLLHLFRA